MPQLTSVYKINNTNLNLRKQFIRFRASDIKMLKRLRGWSNRVADKLAHQFYEHQFEFEPTRQFFAAYAAKKGISLPELRQGLERTQAEYFRQIFDEAANGGEFGVDFFERRLFIGKLHNVINLPLKWYIGSYSYYERLVRWQLCKSFWYNPAKIYKAEKAIFAIFNFDMQAVTDSFFYDYLQSIGLNLSAVVNPTENEDLSEHYAKLKSTVRETLEEAIRTATLLTEASSQLAAASKQSGLATEQIAMTVQEVAKGATQQAAAASSAVSLVSQISQAIDGVAGGAVDQAAAIDTSSRVTHQLSGAIDNVAANVERIEQVKGQVELSAIKVRDMGKQSAQIGAIVSTIDEISSQTNLLALNAAIEAARAGEHGKGFAVVADEVRKLAERASSATREISTLIQSVQQVVKEAVSAMDNSAVEVDRQVAAISAATREMSTFSQELLDAMTSVSAVVQENTAATEQMSAGSGQMLNSIEDIASISQENSAAAEEVSAATEQMSAQVTEVYDSAERLRSVAQKLQMLVSQFDLGDPPTNYQGSRPAHPAGVRFMAEAPVVMGNGKH